MSPSWPFHRFLEEPPRWWRVVAVEPDPPRWFSHSLCWRRAHIPSALRGQGTMGGEGHLHCHKQGRGPGTLVSGTHWQRFVMLNSRSRFQNTKQRNLKTKRSHVIVSIVTAWSGSSVLTLFMTPDLMRSWVLQ